MGIETDNLVCALLIAFLTSVALGAGLTKSVAFLPHAQPNVRSLHAKPVPRVAALMLWAGWLAGIAWILMSGAVSKAGFIESFTPLALFFCGWVAVTAVSLWDDCRSAPAHWRLLAQMAAALAAAAGLYALTSEKTIGFYLVPWWGYGIILVLSTIWMCNLFNFMDGSDGLAVTMALVGLVAYAGTGYAHELSWWWLPLLGVAALIPLLAVNLPPARMFIGDVGAVPLGFLGALFGWWGVAEQAWGMWFPVLVFLPFVLDATITLLRRLWRREKIWEGHKTHYYQRLLQMGAGHRGTLGIYALLMTGCAGTAGFCAVKAPEAGGVALLVGTLVHLGFFAVIDYHWKRRKVKE
ncbi:MAG: glycosyl transferase [Burkholderiales bacterium]|jgi:UDP-N-acetylmuramyl pentapeptide phosphotransferase/UDP-N-acetylglucosamine-1-phosphate transferase|nr:glycosyl transferase [Burkholderiales bacterium]